MQLSCVCVCDFAGIGSANVSSFYSDPINCDDLIDANMENLHNEHDTCDYVCDAGVLKTLGSKDDQLTSCDFVMPDRNSYYIASSHSRIKDYLTNNLELAFAAVTDDIALSQDFVNLSCAITSTQLPHSQCG